MFLQISSQSAAHYQRGVGMVEILVALFVLTIGLLGVASLQFTGTFNNVQAASRSHAELVARFVAEQLVSAAQPSAADDGWEVDDAFFSQDLLNFETLSCTDNNLYQCHCLAQPAAIPNCRDNTCSAAEFAQFSGWEASCQAVASNPGMRINLTCSDRDNGDAKLCSTGSLISITVSWPVRSSQQAAVATDNRCAFASDTNRACVLKEVAL
ncbi:MAG: prepilin-type N-terminal cleavage/methylation domain-containing protein [Alteromonadaceae bacterium]|nr:prepilin-type N-terminal cleavage/methylation domain-containing protein [Alteromonadaceae bacterium]